MAIHLIWIVLNIFNELLSIYVFLHIYDKIHADMKMVDIKARVLLCCQSFEANN